MKKEIKKISSIVLICFLIQSIIGGPLSAQSESLDSLNRVLHLNITADRRIEILNKLAFELRQKDPEKSNEFAEEALNLARKADNKEAIALALSTKGFLLNDADEYSLSLNNYLEAISIYIELGEKEEVALLRYQIGSLYKTLGNYQKAIENCLDGLKIYETLDDKNGIALIYRVMGSIYKYKGEYEKSLFYYFNGLKINEEIRNLPQIANAYNNIGIVYFTQKDFDQALAYYQKSLKINLSLNIETEEAINLGNIGMVFLEKNQLDSALLYFNKRHNAALRLKDKKGIAISLQAFGDYYFRKNEFEKAVEFYNRALTLSREIGILETTKSILKSMSDLYEKDSDHVRALNYYKSYISLTDSLLNSETLQRIEQMEQEYEFEKERNIYFLTEQKKQLYRIVGFAALFLSLLFLFLVYKSQSIKLRRKNLEQKNLKIDKQHLQNEVYFKEKELVSKAINLAEKNELINDITLRLKDSINNPKGSNITLKEILKDLKFHSDTHLWDEFEYTFLQVHPEYYKTLGEKFPELTSNERRLSAFLRLNLSTKEISNITHQSVHSLTVARTRLRKKLGIDHTGENLASFLSKF